MLATSGLSDEQKRLNTRLEAHMIFICPECGKAFRTMSEWRQHLNTRHDYLNKTFSDFNFIQIDHRFHECQLCFKYIENAHRTIALLQYHYFSHLPHRDTYRCVHCKMAYTRRRALNEHLLETHLAKIEQYESKIKHVKANQAKKESLPASSSAPSSSTSKPQKEERNLSQKQIQRQQSAKRNDLLQKALKDIDLFDETPIKTKPNASEAALDRSLSAYENIVRQEEKKAPALANDGADLDKICQKFFDQVAEEDTSQSESVREKPERKPQMSNTNNNNNNDNLSSNEVVTIEIDALGADEISKLQNEMKPVISDSQPLAKRRRLSPTDPAEDKSTSESYQHGMSKFIAYLCPKCGKEFFDMEDWRDHVYKKHDLEHIIEKSFKVLEPGRKSVCLHCNEVQYNVKQADLQKHSFKHMPYRSCIKCTLCCRTKTSLSKMHNHIKYNHQDLLQSKDSTQLLIKPEPKNLHLTNKITSASASPSPAPAPMMNDEDSNSKTDVIKHIRCKNCLKQFKQYWRYMRHMMICNPQMKLDDDADSLITHLREGALRINEIWKEMNANS